MSAFIVGREHIQYLVQMALDMDNGRFSYYHEGNAGRTEIQRGDREAASRLGQILWDENVKSIEHRYPQTKGKPDEMPGPGESMYVYSHKPVCYNTIDRVQVLKSVQCLDYQSCEHEGWEKSEAAAILRSIKSAAIHSLPGYNDAMWGAPEPNPNMQNLSDMF